MGSTAKRVEPVSEIGWDDDEPGLVTAPLPPPVRGSAAPVELRLSPAAAELGRAPSLLAWTTAPRRPESKVVDPLLAALTRGRSSTPGALVQAAAPRVDPARRRSQPVVLPPLAPRPAAGIAAPSPARSPGPDPSPARSPAPERPDPSRSGTMLAVRPDAPPVAAPPVPGGASGPLAGGAAPARPAPRTPAPMPRIPVPLPGMVARPTPPAPRLPSPVGAAASPPLPVAAPVRAAASSPLPVASPVAAAASPVPPRPWVRAPSRPVELRADGKPVSPRPLAVKPFAMRAPLPRVRPALPTEALRAAPRHVPTMPLFGVDLVPPLPPLGPAPRGHGIAKTATIITFAVPTPTEPAAPAPGDLAGPTVPSPPPTMTGEILLDEHTLALLGCSIPPKDASLIPSNLGAALEAGISATGTIDVDETWLEEVSHVVEVAPESFWMRGKRR